MRIRILPLRFGYTGTRLYEKKIIIKTDTDNIKHVMGQGKIVLADSGLGEMYSVSVCSKRNE